MKKYLFLLTTLFAGLFTACTEEEGGCDSCLIPPAEEQLLQNGFADDETTGQGFTFTAAGAWQATVNEVYSHLSPAAAMQAKAATRAGESIGNNVVWLRLYNGNSEVYSGGAGEISLRIEMDQNYTGERREAAITVKSGNNGFIISVVQEATKQDGSENEAPVKVTEIRLDKDALTLKTGEKATLRATVMPEDATIKSVIWTCRDSTVAKVNPVSGEITALGAGTTIVTATSSSNKAVSASCQLTVEETDSPSLPDSTATADAKIARIEVARWYNNGSYTENDGKGTIEFFYDEQGRLVKMMVESDDDAVDVGPMPGDSTLHASRKMLRSRRRGVAASDSVTYDLDRRILNITYGRGEVSYEIVAIEDGEELPYRSNGRATLDNNGRVTSGSVTYYEEEYGDSGRVEWVPETTAYRLSYNALGQLTRVNSDADGIETLTWTDGNLTACTWGDSANIVDKAYYGNLANNLNVDINFFGLLSEAEGFCFATGDDSGVFALLGLTGTRTKNMVERVVGGYSYSSENEFEYVVEGGLITKIITWETTSYAGRYKSEEVTISYRN